MAMDITNNNGSNSNTGFSPIVFDNIPAPIKALGGKSSEEKLYLVLYTCPSDDSNGFILCEGRRDCYLSIARLLNTYTVDIHNSVVLVEVPAVNKNGNGEWMMKHPYNASSIYQFCKAVESMFPNEDFNIDDYNYKNLEEDNDPTPVSEDDLRSAFHQQNTEVIASPEDTEIAQAYKSILEEDR